MSRSMVIALGTLLVAGQPAWAQADHAHSPYAGQEHGEIASLSQTELDGLLAGEGMALARAAELNHFPGPLHLLELAEGVGLDDVQRRRVEEIRSRMLERARALGHDVVQAERALSDLFRVGVPTVEYISEATAAAAARWAELRAVHLRAHIEVRALLTDAQVATYDRLRGYGS